MFDGWSELHGLRKNYRRLLETAALLLALAESLDYTETSQIHVIEPGINKKTATLKLYAQGIPSIEMHQIQEHLSWFKKTFGVELKVQLATAAEE